MWTSEAASHDVSYNYSVCTIGEAEHLHFDRSTVSSNSFWELFLKSLATRKLSVHLVMR